MIAYLSGKVLRVAASSVVLDVGGVGYRVFAPVSAIATLVEGQSAAFHIHTSVREDAIELFGFREEVEQEVFETLISVSGVGPKMALAVLSALPVRDIAAAAQGDGARLQTIPGIGKKTAQRISLEVGEKLQEAALAAGDTARPDAMADVVEGLVALGYSRLDASRAASDARTRLPDEQSPAALIREALALMTKR